MVGVASGKIRPAFSKLTSLVKNAGRSSLVLALGIAKTSLRCSNLDANKIVCLLPAHEQKWHPEGMLIFVLVRRARFELA